MISESPTLAATPAKTASLLLTSLAAAQIVPVGLALLVNLGGVQDEVVRALDRNPEPLGEAGALVVAAGATLAGVIGFVGAVALAVIAAKVSGSGAARAAARVVSGLLLLWSAAVTVINPVGGPLTLLAPTADTNNTLSGRQFQEQLNEALPGWVQPVLLGFALLTTALVIAVYAALARANRR